MSWTDFLPAERAERRRFFPRVQRVLRAQCHCALLRREVAAGSGEIWREIFEIRGYVQVAAASPSVADCAEIWAGDYLRQ